MGTFAFRLSCYHQFGWTYDHVANLPEPEAKLLQVFFEELSLQQAEEARNLRRQGSGYNPDVVEETIGGDEDGF